MSPKEQSQEDNNTAGYYLAMLAKTSGAPFFQRKQLSSSSWTAWKTNEKTFRASPTYSNKNQPLSSPSM
jgi:phage-related protein